MQYKEGDIVTLEAEGDDQFQVVMFSKTSLNLMLCKCGTNELWSAFADDVKEIISAGK